MHKDGWLIGEGNEIISGNTEHQVPVEYRYTDIDGDDIDMDRAIVQWYTCLKLRREIRIEDRNLGVIGKELKIEVKELWIAKQSVWK